MKEKHGNKENLRKPFLAPCQPVLDVLRIHAIAEHKRFEEYFYELIKEGFKVKYGIYPEDEANGYRQEMQNNRGIEIFRNTVESLRESQGPQEEKTE